MPDHHRPGGGFRNPWPGSERAGVGGLLRWVLVDRLRGRATPPPTLDLAQALPRVAPTFDVPRAAPDAWTATWIGHSSFLVQLGGWNVLLDPVFAERASPVRWAGPRRLTPPGVALDALPPIDLVLLSHDHYDHLDADAVRALAVHAPDAHWMAPLGVDATLRRFGAPRAEALDWWARRTVGPLEIACVPAQHFAGRGVTGRDGTLWCGWTLRVAGGPDTAPAPGILYAGDTGLHPEFAAIARAHGPFALALLPIGAYAPRWFMRPVHCDPDDALAAYAAVADAQTALAPTEPPPILGAMHFGTFRLTDEPVDEPARRARAGWAAAGRDPARLWIPQHGETRRG